VVARARALASANIMKLTSDEVEHLLLIGGGQDVVIEDKIGSPLMASQVQQMARQAPRPPVFGNRRPTLRSVENEPAQGYDDGSQN
jgi:hypothetical protein